MTELPREQPIRVTFALTHPIQYYSPWFRFISKKRGDLQLKVVYATIPTAEQQGVGFGVSFEWDTSPLDGYDYEVARASRRSDYLHSDRFFGFDAPEISRTVLATDPDVVVVPGWYSLALARVLAACQMNRVPTLYRGDTQPPIERNRFERALWSVKNKTMLALFDAYLTCGERNRSYLESFGIRNEKIFFAPHAVDNEMFAATADSSTDPRGEFEIPRNDFVILFVGKLDEKKRADDVIRAAARLDSGVTTVIAGAGPKEKEYRELAARLSTNVRFVGFVNQSRLGALYRAADVCVLPSATETETWGLVVNEALACGTPCIVSDHVGCAPDLIHSGVTGEIFPALDVSALAEAIDRIRLAKTSGHDFGAACRDLVSKYSFERSTEGLDAACRFLVATR